MRIRYTHDPFFKKPIAEITYDFETEHELVLTVIELLGWKNWKGFYLSCPGKVALEVDNLTIYRFYFNDYQTCKKKAKKLLRATTASMEKLDRFLSELSQKSCTGG